MRVSEIRVKRIRVNQGLGVFHSNSSVENYIVLSLQTVTVIMKDLMVLNVTMKMDSAPASQTFLARSVNNVLMDSMGFQTVEVGFSCQYFINSYSYTKISFNFNS